MPEAATHCNHNQADFAAFNVAHLSPSTPLSGDASVCTSARQSVSVPSCEGVARSDVPTNRYTAGGEGVCVWALLCVQWVGGGGTCPAARGWRATTSPQTGTLPSCVWLCVCLWVFMRVFGRQRMQAPTGGPTAAVANNAASHQYNLHIWQYGLTIETMASRPVLGRCQRSAPAGSTCSLACSTTIAKLTCGAGARGRARGRRRRALSSR